MNNSKGQKIKSGFIFIVVFFACLIFHPIDSFAIGPIVVGSELVTTYDISSTGSAAWAYGGATDIAYNSASWVAATTAQNTSISATDTNRWTTSIADGNIKTPTQFDYQMYRYQLPADTSMVKRITLSWTGYGEGYALYPITLKIWNFSTSAWEQFVNQGVTTETSITNTFTANLANYMNASKYVYVMAKATKKSLYPAVPIGLVFPTFNTDPTTVTATWTANTDPDILRYELLYTPATGTAVTSTSTTNSKSITTNAAGGTLKVRAVNTGGYISAYCTAVTQAAPASGSCPLIFAYNGKDYKFVSDFISASVLGFYMGKVAGKDLYSPINSSEYIKIDAAQLKEENNIFKLKVNEMLQETTYLDQAELLVIDHPTEFEIYPNETFWAKTRKESLVLTSKDEKLPISAVDDQGHDVLSYLKEIDRTYVPFERIDIQGFAKTHALILDLGPIDTKNATLYINGWTEFPDTAETASINQVLKAEQQGIRIKLPSLEVVGQDGRWKKITAFMGMPAGLTKGMVFSLQDNQGKSIFPTGDHRIRIETNQCIYYDKIWTSAFKTDSYKITRIKPTKANLNYYGISDYVSEDGKQPSIFKYDRKVSKDYVNMEGYATRYGDVLPLLKDTDDQFVIMTCGDQIDLEFSAQNLSKLPAGWKRDFLFYGNGFFKAAKPGRAYPYTIAPLPFHKMFMVAGSNLYTYNDPLDPITLIRQGIYAQKHFVAIITFKDVLNIIGQYIDIYFGKKTATHYPNDKEHLDYLKEYNTRYIPVYFPKGYADLPRLHRSLNTNYVKLDTAYSALSVTSPNGGEVWGGNTAQTITWTTDAGALANVPNVMIKLSTDGGSTYGTTISASTPNNGSLNWTTPDVSNNTTYRIRISDPNNDTSSYDVSNANFSIKKILTITSPNTAVNWKIGEAYPITWTSLGTMATVNLLYSKDSGTNWTEVVNGTGITNTGTFNWTIPSFFTNSALVKVVYAADVSVFDTSDVPFAFKGINITAPNGGESWLVGQMHSISWTYSGNIMSVSLKLSTDGGTNFFPLMTINNAGSYIGAVGNYISETVKLKISDASDDTVSDISDNVFFIRGKLVITSPNTALEWIAGSQHDITWLTSGTIDNVNLLYSIDGGSNYSAIVGPLANEDVYSWTLPLTPYSAAKIKVVNADNANTSDISDDNFIIKGVKLTSPVGTETWDAGTTHNITWISAGSISNVKIDYSTDGGSTYSSIASSVINSSSGGTYSWTIPAEAIGSAMRIKVSDISAPTVINNVSGADFTISGINLISPNGSEAWAVGSAYDIVWTTQGVSGNIKLEYSTNGGSTYSNIASSVTNSGTYSWTIPAEANGTQVRIRASSVTTPALLDSSATNFTISGFTLTSPNGGEIWNAQGAYPITWTTTGTIANVKLDYSTDSGDTWTTISGADSIANVGSYNWTIPRTVMSTGARIRVSSVSSGTIADQSNADFTIKGLLLTVPMDTGISWVVADAENILWTSVGSIPNVKLEYSTDAGISWNNISESEDTVNDGVVANDGSFSLTIPDRIGTQLKIRVSDALDTTLNDVSANNFTVKGKFNLISPESGEVWVNGTSQTIAWTTTGTIANVKIDYSTDGGATYPYVITSSAVNIGNYLWTIPAEPSTTTRLKISDPADMAIEDSSSGNFTLAAVKLLAPNGAESWTVGTANNITWTWKGTLAAVKLEYTSDNGATWNVIKSSASTTTYPGSYPWTIPDTLGAESLVRISQFGTPANNDLSNAYFTISAPLITNVTITPPSGETEFFAGDTAAISWTWVGALKGDIKVSYSIDSPNYTNWTVCSGASALANTVASFNWVIPADALSTNLTKIKIEDTDLGRTATAGQSSAFTVKAQPTITISLPTGDPNWRIGNTQEITWIASQGVHGDALKIEAKSNDMADWVTLAEDASAVAPFSWVVPESILLTANASSPAQIRISDKTRNSATGSGPILGDLASTANFNAVIPLITITAPVSGAYWLYGGADQIITWTTDGQVANVRVSYSKDGTIYKNMTTGAVGYTTVANSGTYSWAIPDDLGACTLKIVDAIRPTVLMTVNFNILGGLTLTRPTSAGLGFVINDSESVTWIAVGTVTPVYLQFSADGVNWYDMAHITLNGFTSVANVPGANSYSWSIPNVVTTAAKVKVYDPNYATQVSSVSSNIFNIGPVPTLTMTAPTGMPSWRVGSAGNVISWTASNNVNDNINVEYSTNGTSWTALATGQSKNGSFNWTVSQADLGASAVSGLVQFRVRDMTRLATLITNTTNLTANILPPTITVEDPATSGYLVVDEIPTLSWSTSGGEGAATFPVAVQYYSTADSSYQNIETTYSSNANGSTTYTGWTVPNKVGISRIKVYDTYRPITASAVSSNFTICGKFNGVNLSGSQVTAGAPLTITWSTTGAINGSNVKLFYFKDENNDAIINDTDFNLANVEIDPDVASKTSAYTWTVPTDVAAGYINTDLKIRIRDSRVPTNTVSYKDTASTFRINGSFAVAAPAAIGENWTIGTNRTVTFNTNGNISSAKIYYTADASASSPTWTLLNTLTPNANTSTSWSWTVADNITSQAQIKVEDANNSSITALSPIFNIKGTLDLTAPEAIENWIIGTEHNITWTTLAGLSSMSTVKLEYSKTNGESWLPIAESEDIANDGIVVNDGSFTWLIPNEYAVAGSQVCKVRVSEPNGLSNTDVSTNTFIIALPVIQILQANGTEQLTLNQTYDATYNDQVHSTGGIKWTTTGTVNTVKIQWCPDYNTNQTWTTIIASENNSGVYNSWSPDTLSGAARLRIRDANHSEVEAISGANFSVLPTPKIVSITHPATADTWILGTPQTIIWTKEGLVSKNLKLEYSYDDGETYNEIYSGTLDATSYNWTLVNSIAVTSDKLAKIRITDTGNSATPVKESLSWTVGIPTVILSRPDGGEVWAVGDNVPVTWSTQGAIADNSIQLGYSTDSGATYPANATFASSLANTGAYSWTVPDIVGAGIRVRARDGSRINSKDVSNANFEVISGPTITVSEPADASEHVVEDPMTINWSVRGLAIDHVVIDYFDDTYNPQYGLFDGTETVAGVISANNAKGTSDTADVYSGKYTGTYSWTVPASSTASSSLKLRVRGYDANNNFVAVGYSPGHFRIKGGFQFRDETDASQVLTTSTNWRAGSTHNIKWYNKGVFPTLNLKYRTATSLGGVGIVPWTSITTAQSNNPDVNNISSQSWLVADPNLNNLPSEPPENYYVQFRVESPVDTSIYEESNVFKISYNTVTWRIRDDESMTLLTTQLGVSSSGSGYNYWNFVNGGLSAPTGQTTFAHRYPQGIFTTIWSKDGYYPVSDVDREINQDVTLDVLMESTTPKEYRVQSAFSYNEDETKDSLMIKAWLEKKGILVNSDSTNALGTASVYMYYGNTPINNGEPVTLTFDPNTGSYYKEILNVTGQISTPGFGLEAGKTYFSKVTIGYGGAQGTRSTYSAGASFDITIAANLKKATEEIKAEVAGVKGYVTAELGLTQRALTTEIQTQAAATQGKIAEVKTETAKILTASETTLPAAITSAREEVVTSIKTEVKPHVQSGILNRSGQIKLGDTITIGYRTATGLSPKVEVYNSKNLLKLSKTMTENLSSPGLYEYNLEFITSWGKGDYSVVCSEATLGTVDAIVLTASSQDMESVAGQVAAVLGSTSGVNKLKGVADTLNSQFSVIDKVLTDLSQKLTGKLGEAQGALNNLDTVYTQLGAISKAIKNIGGTQGINLEKLYQVSKDKKEDMTYLKNKSAELKATMDLNQKMLENVAKKPVVQTWFEFK